MTGRGLFRLVLLAITAAMPARAQDVTGDWRGTYRCVQGLTALELSLRQDAAGAVAGVFHFFSAPGNPGVPEGCYAVTGDLDPVSGRVTLNAGRWLLRPDGYVTVDLAGTLDDSGDRIAGRVMFPVCDKFTVHRVAKVAAAPRACVPPDISLSPTPRRSIAAR